MGLQKQMSDLRDKTQVRIDPMIQTVDHFETSAEIFKSSFQQGFHKAHWEIQKLRMDLAERSHIECAKP